MDMQTPDFETAAPDTTNAGPGTQISPVMLRCLLRILSTTLPGSGSDSAEFAADKWEMAREVFFSLEPRNPVEAVLAARAVAAHFATLDLYARAAVSGTSDEKAMRLRAKAKAETRTFDTSLDEIERRHAQAKKDAAVRDAAPRRPMPPPMPAPIPPRLPGRPTPTVAFGDDDGAGDHGSEDGGPGVPAPDAGDGAASVLAATAHI
jgi:hypothetical protein